MPTIKQIINKILTKDSITYLPNMEVSSIASEDYLEGILQDSNYTNSLYLQTGLLRLKDAISGIEFQVYKIINAKGEAEKIEDHEILSLLDNPNPIQTRDEFLRISLVNFKLSGEFFWRVIFEDNKPKYLYNVNPIDIDVKVNDNGELEYIQQSAKGAITFSPNEIVHFKDPTPRNPLRGEGILKTILPRIQAEIASVQYAGGQFVKNGNPDGVLLYKGNVDKEKAKLLKSSWFNSFRGGNDKNRVAVLGGDVEYKPLANTQTNLDYIATQNQIRDEIITALGIPKSMITTDDVNRANAEAGLEQFRSLTLIPMVKLILGVLNERFIIPNYGEEYYVDTQKLLSENKEQLLSEIEKTVNGRNQILTVNEARQRLGYEPMEGADGLNTFQVSPNLYQVQNAFKGRRNLYKRLSLEAKRDRLVKEKAYRKTVSDPKFKYLYVKAVNAVQDRGISMLQSEMEVYFEDQKKRVLARIENGATNATQILNRVDEKGLVVEAVIPLFKKLSNLAGNVALIPVKSIQSNQTTVKFAISNKLAKALQERAEFLAQSMTDTTFSKIQDVVSEHMNEGVEVVKTKIQELYTDMSSTRARTIAHTESCFVTSTATDFAFKESPVVSGKEWLTSLDDRVRDEHVMNEGVIVDKDGSFPNGENFPGEHTINCRCAIAPVIDINNL